MKKTKLLTGICGMVGIAGVSVPLASCSCGQSQPEVDEKVECLSKTKRFEINDPAQKATIKFKFNGDEGTKIKVKVDGSLEHELSPSTFDITVDKDKLFEINIGFKETPTDLWDQQFSLVFEYKNSDGRAITQGIIGFSIFFNGEAPVEDNDINYTGEKSIIVDTLKPELNFVLDRPLQEGEKITTTISKYNEQSNKNAIIKTIELNPTSTNVVLTLEMDGIVDSGYIAFDLYFSCKGIFNKEIQGFKLIYTKYKDANEDSSKWVSAECFIKTGEMYGSLTEVDFTKDDQIADRTTLPIYANNYQEVSSNIFKDKPVPENIKCLCILGGDGNTTLYIHKDAFKGWDNLEYVYIKGANIYFDSGAFNGCSKLKTINVTNWNDEKINSASPFSEKDVFSGLPESGSILTKQPLNSNIYYAFQSSGIPESWFYYEYTEDSDEQFTYVNVPQTNDRILTGLVGEGNITNDELVIPSDVTAIAPGAFKNCFVASGSSVITVSVEKNAKLKAIHGTSFEGCTSLTTIDLSNATQLSLLGIATFYNCSSASNIILPSSLTDIGTWCFYNCSSLKDENMILNTKIKAITTASFSGCTKLTRLNLNESLASIDAIAFQDDIALESVSIPASVVQIAQASFKGCSKLSNVDFANGSKLKFLLKESFANCDIRSIVLPKSLFMLENAVFTGNKNLTSVSVDEECSFFSSHNNAIYGSEYNLIFGCSGTNGYWERIATIGPNAFENSPIGNEVLDMTETFRNSFEAPVIGEYAFAHTSAKEGVESLDLKLPMYMNIYQLSIKRGAFYDSAISSLKITEHVADIEDEAFMDSKLTKIDVTKLSKIPEWQGKNIFGGTKFPTNGQVLYDSDNISKANIRAFLEAIGLPTTWEYVDQ